MDAQKKYDHIDWSEPSSSGLVYLDNHRRNFIDIVNELVDVVNDDSCDSNLPMIFIRLAFYVEDYFVNKEIALMGNSDLPLQVYKQEHARFTDEVTRHQQAFHQGEETVCRDLLEFIISWYQNYISLFGPEAVEYLRSRGFE